MRFYEKIRKQTIILLTILVIPLILFGHPIYGQEEKQVLFLNSYHANFTWTKNIVDNAVSILDDSDLDIDIYIEYMDWKNFPTEDNLENLYNTYKNKYKGKKIDLIVVSDDKALEFALQHRRDLFYDAPIVFVGVNEEGEKELIKGDTNITGVIEHIDLEQTLDMAYHINPSMEKLYIVYDQTESGISTYNIIDNIIRSKYKDIKPISITNKTHDEVIKDMGQVSGDSAILITTYYQDTRGEPMEFERFCKIADEVSNVPLFHMYSSTIGYGNMGGATVSSVEHGKKAGELALRVLNGEEADDIAIVREFPLKIIFDYNKLEKSNIPMDLIPKEAEIINKPFSFFKTYRNIVIAWAVVIIVLTILILLLTFHIAENKRVRNKLEKMTYLDELTKLPNKRTLQEDFDEYFNNEKNKKGAVIFIDADNFKLINDTLGHTLGDKFIIRMGNRLQMICNKSIKLYRMGGDEFLLLIKGTNDKSDIRKIAKRLMAVFQEGFLINNMLIHTTVSAGIAVYPDDGKTLEDLNMKADIAMYKAKESGKAQYKFFHKDMNDELSERAAIEKELRTAVDNKELYLNYQPQYDLENKEIIGFEALLRWENKELGQVSPYKFIKVAEESHSIIPIGKWVLETACKFIKEIHELGYPDYTVSVNVSALQVMQEDFVEIVLDILKENDLEPKHLEIEMTETMLIENFQIITDKLEVLRGLGVTVALDDFGTGYSSLSYLNRLPIDTLKIDKSFVDTISRDEEGRVIVSILIELGHGMELKVIAEGVEIEEEFSFLKEYKCDSMQGYLLSRPLSKEEIIRLIEA
ncbi:MAG: EAL domain-containing protein [Epulopiscium sp.]|nr:EAL domain-containing protein [Candidatus Epulonipiscium sp.]